MKKIKLNIGSGINLVKGFINVDNYYVLKDLKKGQKTKQGRFKNAQVPKGAKFIQANVLDLPFKDEYADYIESIDMIEHLPFKAIEKALSEMKRVLKKGGEIRMMTTNFDNLAQLWIDLIKEKTFNSETYFNIMEIIYGNQLGNGEFHLSAFNPHYLNYLFNKIGFKKVKIVVYPQGCTKKPALQTQYWLKNSSMRSEMLLVIAKK